MKVDRNGMRIVIELKRDANANIVLNNFINILKWKIHLV